MRGVCLVCVLFFCGTLLADVVVTRDGAHWKGTAKTTQRTVVLETPFGTLRFPWDAVKELRYEPLRHVFLLVSGQKVRVLLVGETPTAYRVILNGRKTEFARGLVERTEDVTPLVEKAHKDLTSNLKKLSEIAKELEKAGLKDEWRRVLRAIHSLNPSDDYAGKNLGYVKVQGVWVKPDFPCRRVLWRKRPALLVDVVGHKVLSAADGETTFKVARALSWLLPRIQKAFALSSLPPVEVLLYRDKKEYATATGRKDAGFYDRKKRRISFYASDEAVRTLFWLLAYHILDVGLGLAPVVEDGKVKSVGAPLWLRQGLALYLEGWALPFEQGAPSSLNPNARIGIPAQVLAGLKHALRSGNYTEPRALTRIPPNQLDKRCLATAWAMIFSMLRTNSPHHKGLLNMLKALKNGKKQPADYFDPFFDQTKLRQEVAGLFARLTKYRGAIARGTYKVVYLWHEDALRLLQARNLDEAIRLYKRIVDRRPKDYIALYNLACAYSLLGDKLAAKRYLLKAWDAGFRDVEHIKRDPDLKNIRDTDIFKALTGQKKEF